jgi:hypothetical protein
VNDPDRVIERNCGLTQSRSGDFFDGMNRIYRMENRNEFFSGILLILFILSIFPVPFTFNFRSWMREAHAQIPEKAV